MAEIEVAAPLLPTDTVRFSDSHRPALAAGAYKATVRHRLVVDGTQVLNASRDLPFVVAGPRFVLAPGEVVSCFPPQGAQGDFADVLPHVLLRRASLPWERSASAGDESDRPPWLALLVLADDEFTATTVAASTLIRGMPATAPGDPHFEPLVAGPDDDADLQVAVIDLDATLAASLLPAGDDLPWLAGVREVNQKNARALVVANRLPLPGRRNVVHLVSVEHQYRLVVPAGAPPAGRFERVPPAGRPGRVRLVSLARWDFDCAPGAAADLRALLGQMSMGDLRLPLVGLGAALGPAEAGMVPLEHRMAGGERGAAWYRGPLLVYGSAVTLPLPVRRADDLLMLEKATGMTDVSYAAAWTLGRLLALRDPAVGVPLHQWKRQMAHAAHAATPAPAPPPAVVTWFENALARLAAVPFTYLVPEPGQLRAETLVTFVLDPLWLAALCDGAFSIGRTSGRELRADVARQAQVLPVFKGRSGLLLRSAAVAGWPDLVVDASDTNRQTLKQLRRDRLADDTLLVLFDGIVNTVDLHPHPQEFHFGFDSAPATGPVKGASTLPWRDASQRVFDASAAARALGSSAPHEFAMRMLESAPRMGFNILLPHV